MITDKFFKLGEKVTGGDPYKKLQFDYYLLWIMFLAFLSILIGNLIDFYKYRTLQSIGWAAVMFAILWFQYHNLVQIRQVKLNFKQLKEVKNDLKEVKNDEVDSIDDMLKGFDEAMKGGSDDAQ